MLNGDYCVVRVEVEVDDETFQFERIRVWSGVEDDEELERTGPGVERSSDSRDDVTSESSGDGEREWRDCWASIRSDSLWRRR